MARKNKTVGPAVAIKVMSPPPKNVVVCMPIIKDGKALGQLQSENLTQSEADAIVAEVNKAIR